MRPRSRITRRRLRRVEPPLAAEPAPAIPARPVRCMCGTILEISMDDHGQRKSCAVCGRRFEVQASYDRSQETNELAIHYLTDQNERTGETCVIGSSTTSVSLHAGAPAPQLPGPAPEPEPPQEMLFKCFCGGLLLVPRSLYERRVRCPGCDARMMVFALFNPIVNTFNVQSFRLSDSSTGTTQVLTKL